MKLRGSAVIKNTIEADAELSNNRIVRTVDVDPSIKPLPEISIGDVETVDYPGDAYATMTGTKYQPLLNLGLPRGPQGATGATGPRGPQGVQGEKGDQGAKGDKGDKGDTGAQGPQGPKVDKGDKGDKGDTGLQGPKGATGSQGPQGPVGPQGPEGPEGPPGQDYNLTQADKAEIAGIVEGQISIPTKVSQLQNDSGFVDATGAASAAPVQSVNGDTGDITGLATTTDISDIYDYIADAASLMVDIAVDGNNVATTTYIFDEIYDAMSRRIPVYFRHGGNLYWPYEVDDQAKTIYLSHDTLNPVVSHVITLTDNGDDTGMTGQYYYNNEEISVDSTPTEDSTNPVESGGVYTALNGKQDAGDYASAKSGDSTHAALRSSSLPWGQVDDTSTSTVFTATITGVTEYRNGVSFWLKNGVVTSAAGFTVNINGLGAKKCYNNMSVSTQDSTIFNVAYTFLFVYDESLDSGAGGFYIYRGYNSDNNTIAYQIRTNSTALPVQTRTRYYRVLFTSADGTKWVPANTSYDNSATSTKTVNQAKIDPFGRIVYMSGTTNVPTGSNVSATVVWDQYALSLGYSFNRTGAALTLTTKKPVYVKCAPQSDGSAIMDSTEPIVQALPNTDDGKIYIYLGIAYSETNIELTLQNPVYYFKNGAVRLWTGPA